MTSRDGITAAHYWWAAVQDQGRQSPAAWAPDQGRQCKPASRRPSDKSAQNPGWPFHPAPQIHLSWQARFQGNQLLAPGFQPCPFCAAQLRLWVCYQSDLPLVWKGRLMLIASLQTSESVIGTGWHDGYMCVQGRRYAAVLVATPLELTNLEFTGLKVPHMPVRKYQTTVTTFVQGRLKPDYFGVEALPRGG